MAIYALADASAQLDRQFSRKQTLINRNRSFRANRLARLLRSVPRVIKITRSRRVVFEHVRRNVETAGAA